MSPELLQKKRNDLQCWRALSILAVLFFHIWPEKFPNGYIGVDIFFLLSGYLMASLYTFSTNIDDAMVDFYFRRIKRILPTYLVIMICSVVILSQKISNEQYDFILEDLKWAIRLATNYEDLLKKRGYFEARANFRFFRHCWSLAVEMQFYVIFPFFGVLKAHISIIKYQIFLLFCICCSLSYQACSSNPTIQYESLFCRIWQFLFGMLAETLPILHIKILPSFLLITCVTTIFCSIPLSWIFLSLMTLFNVGGILIMSNVQLHPFKSLIYFPFLLYHFSFLGDISYILYLIHWPIITYSRYMSSHSILNFFDGFLLLSTSILLAQVAHFILEKPLIRICHNQRNLIAVLFFFYAVATFLPLQLSTEMKLSSSDEDKTSRLTAAFYKNITNFNETLVLPSNWTSMNDVYLATKWRGELMGGIYECTEKYKINLKGTILNYCEITGNPKGTMTALVIGNSFSMNIVAAVSFNPLFSKTYSVWTNGHNFPLHDDFERFLIDKQIKIYNPNVTFVVQRYFQKYMYNTPINEILAHPEFKHWNKILETIQNYTSAIIMNKEQLVFPYDISQEYIRKKIYNLTIEIKLKKPPRSETLEKWLVSLNCSKCAFFDYREAFCDEEYCSTVDKVTGLPLYRDVEHISPLGLRYLKPLIDSALNTALKKVS